MTEGSRRRRLFVADEASPPSTGRYRPAPSSEPPVRPSRALPAGAKRLTARTYLTTESPAAGVSVDGGLSLVPPTVAQPAVTFDVEGTGMDYHGEGAPVAALRLLARTQPGLLNEDGMIDGEGVLVGVVDGPMADHAWLDGGYLASPAEFESFQPDGCSWPVDPVPPFAGHATFVSGMILQQAPGAGVWIEKALESDGDAPLEAVALAATTLADRGVSIMNLSLGTFEDDPALQAAMQALVEDLLADHPGLVIVAAAGNLAKDQKPQPFWPAALDRVVAVGSVGRDDSRAWAPWSNRGDWLDFAAPADGVRSTYLDRPVAINGGETDFYGWADWSGTSFAAAIVSGVLAATMTRRGLTARRAVEWLRAQRPGDRSRVSGTVDGVPVIRRDRRWEGLLDERAKPREASWYRRYHRFPPNAAT